MFQKCNCAIDDSNSVNMKSTKGRRDMVNTFCLFVLQIRMAIIVRENAK